MNNIWISVHLYYTEFNILLVKGIKPFIDRLKVNNTILNYFFIRYWEKGPHIRLRLKIYYKNEALIKEKINTYFSNFFRKFPSYRNNSSSNNFYNNSIQFIEYVPETKRYGGDLAIQIAEIHFQVSSDIVLDLMSNENWNFEFAQVKVLQLHYLFLKAIKISKNNKILMLKKMTNNFWRDKTQKIIGNEKSLDEIFIRKYNENKILFEKIFSKVKDFNSKNNLFFYEIEKMDIQLDNLSKNSKIEYHNSNSEIQRTNLYISYLHMLNNRIGLRNHDEAYINFIMYNYYISSK